MENMGISSRSNVGEKNGKLEISSLKTCKLVLCMLWIYSYEGKNTTFKGIKHSPPISF